MSTWLASVEKKLPEPHGALTESSEHYKVRRAVPYPELPQVTDGEILWDVQGDLGNLGINECKAAQTW